VLEKFRDSVRTILPAGSTVVMTAGWPFAAAGHDQPGARDDGMSRGAHSIADRILEIPITCLFTAINLGVFIIAWTHGEHAGTSLSDQDAARYGAHRSVLVSDGDYWRLLTAVFMHGGWIHLLLNTWHAVHLVRTSRADGRVDLVLVRVS
jgi:hypothetical protein